MAVIINAITGPNLRQKMKVNKCHIIIALYKLRKQLQGRLMTCSLSVPQSLFPEDTQGQALMFPGPGKQAILSGYI